MNNNSKAAKGKTEAMMEAVLAGDRRALAKAISSDPNRQRQVFNSESPAHAYELLHADMLHGQDAEAKRER